MLNSLEAHNFQAYRDMYIKFSPGVNVIIGESDEGKSSITRMLKYLGLNAPRINNYPYNKGKKTDELKITGDFNGTKITRIKSSKLNGYQINDEEPMVCVKHEVPEEVQNIMQIKDINIQDQDEMYFLLNLTPGQVAKKINKIVNLEIMDEVLTSTKTDIFDIKQKVGSWVEQRDSFDTAVKTLSWTKDARTELTEIQTLQVEVDEQTAQYNAADRLSEMHIENIEKLQTYQYLDKAIAQLKQLSVLEIERTSKIENYNTLSQLLDEYTELKTQLTVYKDIHKVQKRLKQLILLTEKLHQKKEIADLLMRAIEMQTNVAIATNDADLAKKIFTKKLKEQGVCPLCFTVLNKK